MDIDKKEDVFGNILSIPNTHFAVGSNLHSDTYYNFKMFFEVAENANFVGELLAKAIAAKGINLTDTTIVSYGAYANLFIHKTAAVLNENTPGLDINYAIANDRKANKLTFQFAPDLKENILVVLPSINVGSRVAKLISKLMKWVDEQKVSIRIHKNIFSVFQLNNEKGNDFNHVIDNKNYTITCLKTLLNKVFEEHKCELCYYDLPIEGRQNPQDERPIFPIKPETESPGLIFGLPNFHTDAVKNNGYENSTRLTLKFNDVFAIRTDSAPNIYGHFEANKTKYVHYIKSDVFYLQNKKNILFFLTSRLMAQIKKAENKKGKKKITELIFITTNKETSSGFLDDFVSQKEFEDKKISVINYEPFNEYPDNFFHFYGQKFLNEGKEKRLIIFYSDVIFNGSSIKELNTFLKRQVEDDGFDIVLTLIDRTTSVTKKRIFRRLYKPVRDASKKEIKEYHANFIAFFKLNVPVLAGVQIDNPIAERKSHLETALNNCHIDALKLKLIKEIKKCETLKSFADFENALTNKPNLYFPFFDESADIATNGQLFLVYEKKYSREHLGLLKLFIYHELSSKIEKFGGTQRDIETLIKELTDYIRKVFFQGDDADIRNEAIEKSLIMENIVKALSRSPFANYEPINKAMFEYCIIKLHKIIDKLSEPPASISFTEFRELKFYIRRTVELNSNTIISQKFIGFIKEVYYGKANSFKIPFENEIPENIRNTAFGQQLRYNVSYAKQHKIEFKYFLSYCFKELLEKAPARAIMIERILNKEQNIPWLKPLRIESKSTGEVEKLLHDTFYSFGRILKTENIDILNRYKEEFLSDISDDNSPDSIQVIKSMDSLQNDINKMFRDAHTQLFETDHSSDRGARKLANNFIGESRFANNAKTETAFKEVKDSICWMLAATKFTRQQSKMEHGKNEANLANRITLILDTVMKIFTPNAGINYVFIIEYQRNDNEKKVYTFSSNKDIETLPRNIQLHSLANLILDGIFDAPKGNVQSLIPIIRTDSVTKHGKSRIVSFSDFFKKPSDREAISLQDAFELDEINYQPVFKDANMIQYFRLSEISPASAIGKTNYRGDGKAVLMICYNHDVTVENFTNFLSVEKVRLLLLIKEELLDYIKKLVGNDAFIEMISRQNYYMSLKHGIENYLDTLCRYSKKDKKDISVIIRRAVIGQIYGRIKSESSRKMSNIDEAKFKKIVSDIFNDEWHGSFPFKKNAIKGWENLPDKLEEVILNVVIPELLINMKKNHPRHEKYGKLMGITIEKNKFIFKNKIYPQLNYEVQKIEDISKFRGLDMCLNILKNLQYIQEENNKCLEVHLDKNALVFTVILNLNKL